MTDIPDHLDQYDQHGYNSRALDNYASTLGYTFPNFRDYYLFVKTSDQILGGYVEGGVTESGLLFYIFKKPTDLIKNIIYDWMGQEMPLSWTSLRTRTFGQIKIDLNAPAPMMPMAACLIDETEQAVYIYHRAFKMPDCSYLPFHRVLLRQMRKNWGNWNIQMLPQGYSSLLKHIGYKQTEMPDFFSNLTVHERWNFYQSHMDYFICYEDQLEFPNFVDKFISDFYPHLKTDEAPQYWRIDESCSGHFMMTVIQDGKIKDYAWPDTYEMGGFYLSCSHRLLDYVEKSPPLNQINEKNFEMGIIIDLDQKKISYWIDGCVDPIIEAQMKKIWQGWDISWHIKGLPYHFYLTGRDPRSVMMPYEELWSEMSHFEHLAKGDKLENWLSREEYYELWDTI